MSYYSYKFPPPLRSIFLPLLLLIALAGMSAKKSASPSPEDVAKADYLYLEALRARSQGQTDASFHLLSRAHELNPADLEIGQDYASLLLLISSDTDTASLAKAMNLYKAYWDANPADYWAGVRYGLLNDRMLNRDEALRVWRTLHLHHPTRSEITAHLADRLASEGSRADKLEALALYDTLTVTEGPGIPLVSKKLSIYLDDADTTAVFNEVDRLRLSSPSNVDYQVFSGEVYSSLGRTGEALAFFDNAISIDPSNGYARYAKAQYFKEQGDSAGYDREVMVALRQPGLDVDTKLLILTKFIGDVYDDSVQVPRVCSLFDTLIVIHPLEHDIHELYGRYLTSQALYPEAAEQVEQTLGLNPADPQGWEMLASLYLQTNDLPNAKNAIERSFRYYPDEPRQHLMLGSIYSQEKDFDMAIKQYETVVALTPEDDAETLSQTFGLLGDAYYSKQMPDTAFTFYNKSLLYNPDNYLALNNAAYFMACEGKDLDKALAMIERVIAAEPDRPTSMDTYAWVLFKRKEYDRAREVMDRVLELTEAEGDELTSELLDHAGDIYFMGGEPREAVDFWRRALKLDPDNEKLKEKVKHKCLVK